MKDIKLFIEGFIIGIGKIIPGVSGAMFAMMFGVYEKALDIISNLKTKLFKNFKFMMILGTSILLAIILGSGIIKKCLDNYYLPTMMLFIGMMSGGIKPLCNKVKGVKIEKSNIICAVVAVTAITFISMLDFGVNEGNLEKTPLTVLLLAISGFVDAFATVTPGICGTALLMIIGYYDVVITSLGDIFNLANLEHNLFVLIPFVIGLLLGVYLISKLINYLFKNHKIKTYYSIIGFAITSIILLFKDVLKGTYLLNEIILSIVLFIIGYIIVYLLERQEIE